MALLPLAGLALADFLFGGGSAGVPLPVRLLVLPGWVVLSAWLLVRFPQAGFELLALALVVTACIVLLPAVQWIAAGAGPAFRLATGVALAGAALAAWIRLCTALPLAALYAPRRRRRIRLRLRWTGDPAQAMAALRLGPGTETPFHRAGPLDAKGWFDVWTKTECRSLCWAMDETPEFAADFRVRILDEGPFWQEIETASVAPDGWRVTTRRSVRVEPARHGTTRIRFTEEGDGLSDLLLLFYWLTDHWRDQLTARLDHGAGLPQRAVCTLPPDGPRAALLRRLPFGAMLQPRAHD